mmetsp:Transcript_16365/g.36819  ORF Transcript_16365/g.36819 Transcript_16365/m.36819 type:complete len:116 (-) Transcript_16365:26-373(-)
MSLIVLDQDNDQRLPHDGGQCRVGRVKEETDSKQSDGQFKATMVNGVIGKMRPDVRVYSIQDKRLQTLSSREDFKFKFNDRFITANIIYALDWSCHQYVPYKPLFNHHVLYCKRY